MCKAAKGPCGPGAQAARPALSTPVLPPHAVWTPSRHYKRSPHAPFAAQGPLPPEGAAFCLGAARRQKIGGRDSCARPCGFRAWAAHCARRIRPAAPARTAQS
ncbi:MAG: hypothetical protein E2582_17990 [Delftia sp.]|nr:hypothetical protein [Delftia sp.]QFS63365.1 hypothetical protein GCS91_03055 [Delftia tsuruhatensis]